MVNNVDNNSKELLISNAELFNLLISNGAEDFTSKVNLSDKYDIVESYVFGDRFKAVIDRNLITTFAIKCFVNNKAGSTGFGEKFCKFKVMLRIDTPDGVKYLSCTYGIGYNTKELFQRLETEKINPNCLPLNWLHSMKITVRRDKKSGELYYNADIIDPDRLIADMK